MRVPMDATTAGWLETARRFAEEELIPCEVEAEMNEGRLAGEDRQGPQAACPRAGFQLHGRASGAWRPGFAPG